MGDALDQITELRLVDAVRWIGSVLVQDRVVFSERVRRVYSEIRNARGVAAVVSHTEQECQQIMAWKIDRRLCWMSVYSRHDCIVYNVRKCI